jgi:hypothetical protein
MVALTVGATANICMLVAPPVLSIGGGLPSRREENLAQLGNEARFQFRNVDICAPFDSASQITVYGFEIALYPPGIWIF